MGCLKYLRDVLERRNELNLQGVLEIKNEINNYLHVSLLFFITKF